MPAATPLALRLMRHVTVGDGCWEWTGATSRGYGRISLEGQSSGSTGAHRAMYELLVGPIPEGLQLDHLCRNRRCVRPDHLEPVTQAENIRRGGPATKTHCKWGHPFDDVNTYRHGSGQRMCRICNNQRVREMPVTTTRTQPFRVHMPPDLYALVQQRAREADVSMSQWIKDAIAARLEREAMKRPGERDEGMEG